MKTWFSTLWIRRAHANINENLPSIFVDDDILAVKRFRFPPVIFSRNGTFFSEYAFPSYSILTLETTRAFPDFANGARVPICPLNFISCVGFPSQSILYRVLPFVFLSQDYSIIFYKLRLNGSSERTIKILSASIFSKLRLKFPSLSDSFSLFIFLSQ